MKRAIKYTALALISVFVILYLMANLVWGMERKHPILPYIDTQLASTFKIEDWEKVKIGMKRNQVDSLFGAPLSSNLGRLTSEAPLTTYAEMHYSMDGKCSFGDFAWRSFDVYLDSTDTVIATSSKWWED
jgi:hypothetical protein